MIREKMGKRSIFGLLLVFVIGIATWAVFSYLPIKDGTPLELPLIDYEEVTRNLNDSIETLNAVIVSKNYRISLLEKQRDSIESALNRLSYEYEKTDTELALGDWEYNVEFLTNYLSEKDSVRE